MGSANQPAGASEAPTRERLLQTALEMIAERGFAATSVDALAKRARVDKSAVYWNFKSKDGLLQAVVDDVTRACVLEAPLAVGARSPTEAVTELLSSWSADLLARRSKLRVLLSILVERSDVDEETRETLRRYYQDASATLASNLRAAQPALGVDAALVADLLLAQLQGIFLRSLVQGDEREEQRLLDGLKDAALALVERRLARGGRGTE